MTFFPSQKTWNTSSSGILSRRSFVFFPPFSLSFFVCVHVFKGLNSQMVGYFLLLQICSYRLSRKDGWCFNCSCVALFILIIQPIVKSLFNPTTGAPKSGWARLSGLAVLNWVKRGHTVWFFWRTTQDFRSEIVVGIDGTPALKMGEKKSVIKACFALFFFLFFLFLGLNL